MDPEPREEVTASQAVPVPQRLQRRWIAAGIVATSVVAALAGLWNGAVALGVVLGGATGTLAFWLLARQTAGLLGLDPARATATVYRGVGLRLALYAAVLVAAYSLDRTNLYVFAGAAGGIVLVRFAVVLSSAAEARRAIKSLRDGEGQ